MADKSQDSFREQILDKLFLGDELTPEEKGYYDQIKEDPAFIEEQSLLASLKKPLALEHKKRLKSQLVAKEKQLNKPHRIISLRYVLAAAASLVALVAVSFLLWPDSTHDDLFASHYKAYPSIINPVLKGEQHQSSSFLEEAMSTYQEMNYQKTKELLSMVNPVTDTVLFYLAIAEIELGEEKKALEIFDLIENKTSRFYQESQWYKALVNVKTGQQEKAHVLFQSIAKDVQHPYADEAARILRKMK